MVLGGKASHLGSPGLHPVCAGGRVAATVGGCSKRATTRWRQGSSRAVTRNAGEGFLHRFSCQGPVNYTSVIFMKSGDLKSKERHFHLRHIRE